MPRLLNGKKLRGFAGVFLFLIPVLAHAQRPGSFYWGDSDGDGIISGIDYSTLVSVHSMGSDLNFEVRAPVLRSDPNGTKLSRS